MAVSFAATIVADLCRRGGSQIRLVVDGQNRGVVQGAASQGLLGEMMSALAVADAAEAQRLPEMIVEGLRNAPRNARLVLVSTRRIDLGILASGGQLPESAAEVLKQMRQMTFDCSSREIDEFFTLS